MKSIGDSIDDVMSLVHAEAAKITANWDDEHDARIAERRKLEAERSLLESGKSRRRVLAEGGFPALIVECALAATPASDTPTMERLRRYRDETEDARRLVVLSGGVGAGKTVAATWLANQAGTAPMFLRAATFAASGRYDRELRQRWESTDLLVLDDLGAEYLDTKGSFLVDLDELLDIFYSEKRTMVITTNLAADGFKQRYGGEHGRIVSRIRQAGIWVVCGGTDLREAPRQGVLLQ